MGLPNSDVLFVGVNDPDGAWNFHHVSDTAKHMLQLDLLATKDKEFLLSQVRTCYVVKINYFKFFEALKALVNSAEVGKHSTQPAVIHIRHSHAGSLLSNCFLRLLLRSDKHDAATVSHGLLNKFVCTIDVGKRLLQINNVNAIALGENKALHLGIPTTGLVPEVNAAIE